MTAVFPSKEWLEGLETKLNSDPYYGAIARNWEGDLFFFIEPSDNLKKPLTLYLDLCRGKCRKVEYQPQLESYPNPTFTLTATYGNISAILAGNLNPITAMMTSKLKVKGRMSYMMRNVPTVLEFVRCARDVTEKIL